MVNDGVAYIMVRHSVWGVKLWLDMDRLNVLSVKTRQDKRCLSAVWRAASQPLRAG